MRITEKLITLSLIAVLAGCSTINSINPFATKPDPKTLPAPLVDIKSPIATRTAWTYAVGKSSFDINWKFWNSKENGGVYQFSPAYVDNALFVAGSGGLSRLDPVSGKELWKVKPDVMLTAGVGTDGKIVVVGGLKGVVLAYDIDGKELWRAQASSEVLASPVVGQDVVVVLSGDNRIVGYDAKTGTKKWSLQRTVPPLTLRSPPGMVVSGTNVYVAQPGGKLLALTLVAGLPRWDMVVGEPRGTTELERVTDIAGTPAVFDKDICTATFQGKIGCYDLATGAVRWTKAQSTDVGVAVDQRFVFSSDEKGALVAYNRDGGQNAWKNDKLWLRQLSTPVSYGRLVAVGDFQGYIHFLSREDGAFIGRISTDGSPINSVPVVAGSNLIFQTESGTVTAIAVE